MAMCKTVAKQKAVLYKPGFIVGNGTCNVPGKEMAQSFWHFTAVMQLPCHWFGAVNPKDSRNAHCPPAALAYSDSLHAGAIDLHFVADCVKTRAINLVTWYNKRNSSTRFTMERYKQNECRYQAQIVSYDDMVAMDAEVRVLELIVEKLDIGSLGFRYTQTRQTGRKPYDAVDMFKLYAYSYFNGIRSSRKIEKECKRNIELMWLVNSIQPDFKTIADFRKDNKQAITAAFQRFGLLCCELGLVGKEMVAVDGSKFRASNSRNACHTEKKLAIKIEYYEQQAKKYIALLESADGAETNTSPVDLEAAQQKLASLEKRLERFKALQRTVKENGPVYETDTDARYMRTNNNGADICHNVQIAVEGKNHLVIAMDVTSQPVDKEQLHNMATRAKEQLGVPTLTVVADKGYYSAPEFKKCKEDGIVPIVSKAVHNSTSAASAEYGKEAFRFNEKLNGYICPQGQLLTPFVKRKQGKYSEHKRYTNFDACVKCKVKEQCTTSKRGRTIEDKPYTEYAREVDRYTIAHMDLYKQRRNLVEHPFGTVKRAFGFTHFLTRGTESVRAESALHFLAYNMKRLMNIWQDGGIDAAIVA